MERTAQLVVLSKPILNEIRNLSSIQFSANIDMYLGFRLRAAERLVQAFPHGPQNLPALVTVLNDFVFAIRDILLFMGKTVVQNLEQPSASSTPLDGAPSTGAVAATVTFFRLIEGAARDLSECAPELVRLARPALRRHGRSARRGQLRTPRVHAAVTIDGGLGRERSVTTLPAQCSSSREPKPSILSSMPFWRSAHQ